MNKKKKGFLCLALCLILTVSFGMQGLRVNATNMSSITSDSIRDKQDQIKQAEKEREQMKSNLSNLEQIKKDLETQKTNLKNYVTQLDQNLSQIEQNIADLKNKITAKEEEIAKTQAELDAALEREENQKDAMIRRIRIMYEKGDSYILDMMLKAESFSDFLNRADFMDLIMAYDRQQWKDFMENRKYIEDNILFHHPKLAMGEFAIGTNTTAYVAAQKYNIADKLPILIAEKMGPHFAVGDTCYSWSEDSPMYNPDGKEIIARDNEISEMRKEDVSLAYYGCHTDITIPYDELGSIRTIDDEGDMISIIEDGRFVLPGTEALNEPFGE